jgi:hypothetical protein
MENKMTNKESEKLQAQVANSIVDHGISAMCFSWAVWILFGYQSTFLMSILADWALKKESFNVALFLIALQVCGVDIHHLIVGQ